MEITPINVTATGTLVTDETTKPGYKTTEFWLKLAAIVLTALFAAGAIPTTGPLAQATAMIATMLGALGYTVSRTQVKRAAIMYPPELPALEPDQVEPPKAS